MSLTADTNSLQIEWQYLMTSILALGCIKLSFLFFYRRIFCKTNKRDFTNIFTMVMICIIILWTIGFFFAHLFACGTNFSAWWGAPIELITRCVKTEKLLEALAISDFLTDAIIVVIPLPLVCTKCTSDLLRLVYAVTHNFSRSGDST